MWLAETVSQGFRDRADPTFIFFEEMLRPGNRLDRQNLNQVLIAGRGGGQFAVA